MAAALAMIPELSLPPDFVVLHIAAGGDAKLGAALLHELIADPGLAALVDELYYQWQPSAAVQGAELAKVQAALLQLRQGGVRGHGWV